VQPDATARPDLAAVELLALAAAQALKLERDGDPEAVDRFRDAACAQGERPHAIEAILADVRRQLAEPESDETELGDVAPNVEPEHDEPHLAAVPAYPTDAVTEPLRSLVEAGEHCRVAVAPSWIEPPALWAVALGPASTGKSPGWRYGWAPVWDAESARRTLDEAALDDWRALPPRQRAHTPLPKRTTRILSDATVEALVRRLADAGPQVLAVDELRSWLGGLGRYGAGAAAQRDIGHYLSMWDASAPIAYDRVAGGVSVVAPDPAVAIVGTLQAEDHRLLGGVETGLRARWLPHVWRAASRSGGEDYSSVAVPEVWLATLRRLAASRLRLCLALDGEARQLWSDARRQWTAMAQDASPGIRAAAQKSDRQALRIALVLAVASGADRAIPVHAMRGAIALVDYVLGCWRALPEGEELTLSRAAERTSAAVERLAAWLERQPGRSAPRGRILRSQVAGVRTSEVLEAVLEHYEQTYPGSIRGGESTARGGRRGTLVYAPRRGEMDSQFVRARTNSELQPGQGSSGKIEEYQGLEGLPTGENSHPKERGTRRISPAANESAAIDPGEPERVDLPRADAEDAEIL
jgi:hypothetical protein